MSDKLAGGLCPPLQGAVANQGNTGSSSANAGNPDNNTNDRVPHRPCRKAWGHPKEVKFKGKCPELEGYVYDIRLS